jgi:hypothetical protein
MGRKEGFVWEEWDEGNWGEIREELGVLKKGYQKDKDNGSDGQMVK